MMSRKRRPQVPVKPLRPYEEVKAEVSEWLGAKMRRRIQQLQLSLPELEEMTGIGASTICDYLAGRYEPSLSRIILLGMALRVPFQFFFEKSYELAELEDKKDTGIEAKSSLAFIT